MLREIRLEVKPPLPLRRTPGHRCPGFLMSVPIDQLLRIKSNDRIIQAEFQAKKLKWKPVFALRACAKGGTSSLKATKVPAVRVSMERLLSFRRLNRLEFTGRDYHGT